MKAIDPIKEYAQGVQDIDKYKKALKLPRNKSSWIKIDWFPKRMRRKLRERFINKNLRVYVRLRYRNSKKLKTK